MAVKLTTPKTEKTITDEAITRFNLVVPHVYNSETNIYEIDVSRINLRLYIQECASDGTTDVEPRTGVVNLTELPPSVKQALRAAYEEIEAWAQTQGIIGDGTAEAIVEPAQNP